MSEFIKKHKTGIIGTIIFHGMVVVLFMLFGYSTPLPLPGEEGILINFGDTETGMGDIEPRITEPVKQEPVKEQEESVEEDVPTPSEDGAVTQDFEDAPAVKEQGKKEEEKTEEVKKETEEETQEEQTEEKEEEEEERRKPTSAVHRTQKR